MKSCQRVLDDDVEHPQLSPKHTFCNPDDKADDLDECDPSSLQHPELCWTLHHVLQLDSNGRSDSRLEGRSKMTTQRSAQAAVASPPPRLRAFLWPSHATCWFSLLDGVQDPEP